MSQLKDMRTLPREYVKFLLGEPDARPLANGVTSSVAAPERSVNVASAESPAAKLDRIRKA